MSEEFSFTILNSCSSSVKSVYRNVEKHLVKIVTVSSHLCFNETCSNNTILPTYTNIYIYIYIYIYICTRSSDQKLSLANALEENEVILAGDIEKKV